MNDTALDAVAEASVMALQAEQVLQQAALKLVQEAAPLDEASAAILFSTTLLAALRLYAAQHDAHRIDFVIGPITEQAL